MSNIDKHALTAESARESGNILLIVAARMARRELFTPLHYVSELPQKVVSMRVFREALERSEETLQREVCKIVDGHDRMQKKLKEAEAKLETAEKRIAELESDNAYIRNRHKELDLLIGKNILLMQAAIIEWQGTGDARKGMAWIYSTLLGPGELPDEAEKDAQAYFDRKYAPLDEELMNLHRWFWEQSEAERAAEAGKGEAS
ncbi:ead/Ea22-like family protein [Enterobacter hormaechei subsp. xiangfangensis]